MDYGLVSEIPKNLNKGDYFIYNSYQVCRTGKLEQFYTLYVYQLVQLIGYWVNDRYSFVQNLSLDKEDALIKAESLKALPTDNIDFFESPKQVYNKFESFNLEWKAGRNCYYAFPNKHFWEIWKKDKEDLKKQGFWVSKKDQHFFVFFKRKK